LERDDQAIRALTKCIQLDPGYKAAFLALSVSYTNEGMIKEGHGVLERWVTGPDARGSGQEMEAGLGKRGKHDQLTAELMRIAREQPEGDIDADVQVALGVLFNANEVGSPESFVPEAHGR
jgi:peroxin-5